MIASFLENINYTIRRLSLKNRARFVNLLALLDSIFNKRLTEFTVPDPLTESCERVRSQGWTKIDISNFLTSSSLNTIIVSSEKKLKDFKITNSQAKNKKSYLLSISDIYDYDIKSEEMSLALNKDLLALVGNYFGLPPMLWNINLLYSPATDTISTEEAIKNPQSPDHYQGSQLWHLDAEDFRVIKIWIILRDLGIDSGPLNLIPINFTESVIKETGYQRTQHLYDSQIDLVFRRVNKNPSDFIRVLTGCKGSAYAFDSANVFHFGSRGMSCNERLILSLHYVSSYSTNFLLSGERKRRYKYFKNSYGLDPGESKGLY